MVYIPFRCAGSCLELVGSLTRWLEVEDWSQEGTTGASLKLSQRQYTNFEA
jgi:hypothetical protein